MNQFSSHVNSYRQFNNHHRCYTALTFGRQLKTNTTWSASILAWSYLAGRWPVQSILAQHQDLLEIKELQSIHLWYWPRVLLAFHHTPLSDINFASLLFSTFLKLLYAGEVCSYMDLLIPLIARSGFWDFISNICIASLQWVSRNPWPLCSSLFETIWNRLSKQHSLYTDRVNNINTKY